MKNDIADILFKYTTGEATLEETNDALKEAEAGFSRSLLLYHKRREKERRQIMRRGKKPTRKQKIRLGQAGLAPENWLVVKQKANGELIILNKYHDTIRVIPPLAG